MLTVATEVESALQVPPVAPSVIDDVAPWQKLVVPVMVPADGAVLMVMVLNVSDVPQVLETVYVMRAVPAALPYTSPVVSPTDAMDGLLLLQVPPDAVSR